MRPPPYVTWVPHVSFADPLEDTARADPNRRGAAANPPARAGASMSTSTRSALLWIVVALACLARFINLDADPKFESWIFYVEDEGRWVETARSLALFGDPGLYDISRLHLVLSTGFQAVTYVVFELAGVGLWPARLWSAISAAGILLCTLLLLRRRASFLALILGIVVLALDPLTLSLGRTALPEVPSLLFTLLAFAALLMQRRKLGAGLSGLSMAVAVAMKGTTVLIVPVFLLMAAVSDRGTSRHGRFERSFAFLLGFMLPAALAGVFAVLAGLVGQQSFGQLSHVLSRFLDVGDIYLTATRFFAPTKIQHFNLLLMLVAWLCSWTLVLYKEFRRSELAGIYLLSGVWAFGWLAIWYSMNYSPERYSVHLILPLVIHLVAGLSLWRILGPARVLAAIDQHRRSSGLAFHLWLVLPSAAAVSQIVLEIAGSAGWTIDRLIYRLVAFAVTAAVFIALARRNRLTAASAAAWIAFPVALALLTMSLEAVASISLPTATVHHLLPVANAMILIGIGAGSWLSRRSIGSAFGRPLTNGVAVGLVAIALALESAPILIHPTYSIRDASRDIARRFPDATLLQSSGAGLLMLETRLRYRDTVRDNQADGLISFDRRTRPGATFVPVTSYRLVVHPRFDGRGRPRMDAGDAMVDVYRNTQSGPGGPVPAPR